MPNACITGTGSSLPPRVVTNDDLIRDHGIDTTDAWIVQRTGISARRFVDAGVGTADLALPAARRALEAAGLSVTDLDLIVFATLSPEQAFPGSGVRLQALLGAPEAGHFVAALDIRDQCSGFVYGLATAVSMVRSGAARHVLVVGAEIHSTGLDLTTRGRTVAPLFGDGAGAVVVSATEDDRGVRVWQLGSDGRYADALGQRVWDISRRPFLPVDEQGRGVVDADMMYAHMNGKLVFRHAVQRLEEVVQSVCAEVGLAPTEADLVLFHQANLRINELVARRLGLDPARVPHNIERYGNTTAATLPLLLDEAVRGGVLRPGMRVVLAAFGSGFTWGGAVIDW